MPQVTGNLVKAALVNIDTGVTVPCHFNPESLKISKTNTWTSAPVAGKNVPTLSFSAGGAAVLTLDLLFDTYEIRQDVRRVYTDHLLRMAMVDETLKEPKTTHSRPPLCRFVWGQLWSFVAVITSMTQTFTMFLEDGRPVRAKVSITLTQQKDDKKFLPQNPTSGGNPGYRSYKLRAGEPLDLVAANMYGDSQLWRFIAERNGIDNPLNLPAGTVLTLPPSP